MVANQLSGLRGDRIHESAGLALHEWTPVVVDIGGGRGETLLPRGAVSEGTGRRRGGLAYMRTGGEIVRQRW